MLRGIQRTSFVSFLIVCGAAVGLGVSVPVAHAADIPTKAIKVPGPVITGTWTGFYVGAVAGGAVQNTIIDDKDCNLSCSSQNLNGSGFTAGVTAGWNYQFGPGLVGIEGDFNWANFKGSFTDPQWSNPTGTIHSAEWKSFSTVRGRVGLVVDRALLYATGGVAFVDINDYAHSLTRDCNSRGCFSVTGVQTGIAAGFGAEYALGGPWSAKGEYLYVALPTRNVHDLVRTSTSDTYNVKSDAHIVRLGLNYHFNGGLPTNSAAFAMASAAAPGGWTGFYIGGTAGGALQNTILDDKNCNLSCSSQNLNGSGFTGGVTGGWNYQFGPGLVGIEGDFNWADFKGSFTDPQWSNPNGTIHSATWKWFSTVRGRAGLVVDRALVYATAGVAFVDIDDYAHSLTTGCSTRGCYSVTGVQTGLAAGFGAEYALWGAWSAKGEYLYVTLPTKNTHDLVRTGTFDTYNVKSDAHIVRLGLNYHLNGGLPATSAAFAMASAGPVANWTGFYIGGVAGGALQNTIMDDKDCNLSCSSQNLNGSGFTGGVTGGWNYQFGSGVVGIEGDFNWAHFKGSFTDPQWSNPNGTIHSAEWKSFSTVRGRAGLAVGQTLIYATGGVAFVDIDDFAHSLTTGCSTRGCFSVTGWQTGLAAGAGAEYAFWGPWSAKAEYLYVGLPTKNTHDLVLVPTFNTYNVKSDAHIVRLGLNYHFR